MKIGEFDIETLCVGLAQALAKDGRSLHADRIQELLEAAARETTLPIEDDSMPVQNMFVIFASWMEAIGVELGFTNNDDCDALAWAEGLPEFSRTAHLIPMTVIESMSAADRAMEEVAGISPMRHALETVGLLDSPVPDYSQN